MLLFQVRIENLKDATLHIGQVLERVKHEHLCRTYELTAWTDVSDFLTQIAHKSGRLLKVQSIYCHKLFKKILLPLYF